MTWTIIDHGETEGVYRITVDDLLSLTPDFFDYYISSEVLEERTALYTAPLVLGCVGGEHFLRLGGDETNDMPSNINAKLVEVHGSLDALRGDGVALVEDYNDPENPFAYAWMGV